MKNLDTIHLLKECDAGTKMAVSSLDEVLDKVVDSKLKELLLESKEHHEKLQSEIHLLLSQEESEGKEPNPIAKGMSWMKTNLKLGMESSDATIADLITDGCDMGVKSLNKYLNQYELSEQQAKDICKKLIEIEEKLGESLRKFL